MNMGGWIKGEKIKRKDEGRRGKENYSTWSAECLSVDDDGRDQEGAAIK